MMSSPRESSPQALPESSTSWDSLLQPLFLLGSYSRTSGTSTSEYQERRKLWLDHLPAITKFAIARWLSTYDQPIMFRALHGFTDTSSYAYGAAIYLRHVHSDNTITVTLVTAKAKVLPIKPITIPKAELLAAHLMVCLLSKTAKLLHVPGHCLHAWSDSEIVLHWIQNPWRSSWPIESLLSLRSCRTLAPCHIC